jgi:hypothetical protein
VSGTPSTLPKTSLINGGHDPDQDQSTSDERKAIEEARKEIREGATKALTELLRELG